MFYVCVCECVHAALNPKGHFKWDGAVTKCHINITRTEADRQMSVVLKRKNVKNEDNKQTE